MKCKLYRLPTRYGGYVNTKIKAKFNFKFRFHYCNEFTAISKPINPGVTGHSLFISVQIFSQNFTSALFRYQEMWITFVHTQSNAIYKRMCPCQPFDKWL